MPDKRQNHDRLRNRLEVGEREVSEADCEALLELSDTLALVLSRIGVDRHEKLFRHCTILAEKAGGLADSVTDREAAEDIVRTIHREYDNPETNKDCRNALRAFGRFLTDGDDVPGSMAWIPTSTSITTTRRRIPETCSTGRRTSGR
jgi:hypothetical protein